MRTHVPFWNIWGIIVNNHIERCFIISNKSFFWNLEQFHVVNPGNALFAIVLAMPGKGEVRSVVPAEILWSLELECLPGPRHCSRELAVVTWEMDGFTWFHAAIQSHVNSTSPSCQAGNVLGLDVE